MSTALDDFERQLVRASRALHGVAEVTHGPAAQNGSVRRRKKLFRRARQLGLGIQLGLAVASLGSGLAGYLLLSAKDTLHTLPSFECQMSNGDAIINAVTGDPAIDCAAAWPSASGGRESAPPLAVWGSTSGRYAAVARPASWGPPPGGDWRRLPRGWTVDLRIVALADQLADISFGAGAGIGVAHCMHTTDAVRAVRRLLAIDRMRSWRVVVRPAGQPSGAEPCTSFGGTVLAEARTVQLDPFSPAVLPRTERIALRKLEAVDQRVNRVLRARCATVPAAAALWTREARAVGLLPATLSFWRALNGPHPPRNAADYYTLYKQPASQHTGTCAHILVSVEGGGGRTVYAARIAP